nr:reverse transcriptase domain-containing protein [Tanacetum cinerariifolium]
MPPRMTTRSTDRPAVESLGGGTGVWVGRGGRGRRTREGNNERVDDLNGQGNNQVMGAPDFSTIIFQELQNLLPAMLAQICEIMAATEPKNIQKAVHVSGALTDEKIGNVGEPNKDKNSKDDNKRTTTGNALASIANPVGRENTRNQARGKAFMLGAEEARQDQNIVRSLEPIKLGFKYEIKITSGQLVEIDKEVRIPLPDSKVLRVLRERLEEKARLLMSAKASDKKQEEIVVVRDFLEVFPDDLSGLPPIQEIEF